MKNEIMLKVYDVDYSFILKNYLSPELWQKTWTLFVYDNVRITLDLDSIDVKKPISIRFMLKIQDENHSYVDYIRHDTLNSNLNVLKKQINGAITRLITNFEESYIREEQGYIDINKAWDNEREYLENIAKEYLDECGVSQEDIRQAYIDKYVDDNEKGYNLINTYINDRKYHNQTKLWLVYYKAIKDEESYDYVLSRLGHDVDKEVQEFIDIINNEDSIEYDDWYEEMKDKLEVI